MPLTILDRAIGWFYRIALSPLYTLILRARGVKIGRNVIFYGMPLIQMSTGSEVTIGDRTVLCSISRFTAMGVNQRVTIKTLTSQAKINIGSDVGASGITVCATTSILIANECLLGSGCQIFDTDFHPIAPMHRRRASINRAKSAPVHISENVFLGARSQIFKGVCVGKNSIVGAGSTVVKNIPDNSIWAGSPASFIKFIDSASTY